MTASATTCRVRALVIPASGWWIIQFIDHDMAEPARDLENIDDTVRELFERQERRTLEDGDPSWTTYPLAPEEYVERFNVAEPFGEFAIDLPYADCARVVIELRVEGLS